MIKDVGEVGEEGFAAMDLDNDEEDEDFVYEAEGSSEEEDEDDDDDDDDDYEDVESEDARTSPVRWPHMEPGDI